MPRRAVPAWSGTRPSNRTSQVPEPRGGYILTIGKSPAPLVPAYTAPRPSVIPAQAGIQSPPPDALRHSRPCGNDDEAHLAQRECVDQSRCNVNQTVLRSTKCLYDNTMNGTAGDCQSSYKDDARMNSLSMQRDHSSLADKLAKEIRGKLQSKPFRDGDVFMTEAQVASEFEVSRTIVREAVSRLRALGILEGRQGKGLVARRPDLIRLISESVPSLAGSEKDFCDLIELRYVLEVGGIELAVANATPTQIEQLRKIAEHFAEAVESGKGNKQQNSLDLQFHTLLLEMTHSTLIAGFNGVLARFFESHVLRDVESVGSDATTTRQHQEETAHQHFELVSAIESRDVERARSVIRSHIHCYLRHSTQANQLSEKGLVAAIDQSPGS